MSSGPGRSHGCLEDQVHRRHEDQRDDGGEDVEASETPIVRGTWPVDFFKQQRREPGEVVSEVRMIGRKRDMPAHRLTHFSNDAAFSIDVVDHHQAVVDDYAGQRRYAKAGKMVTSIPITMCPRSRRSVRTESR